MYTAVRHFCCTSTHVPVELESFTALLLVDTLLQAVLQPLLYFYAAANADQTGQGCNAEQ